MFAVYPNQNKIVKLPLGMNDKAEKSDKTGDKGGNNDARKKRDTYQVSATKAEDVVRLIIIIVVQSELPQPIPWNQTSNLHR